MSEATGQGERREGHLYERVAAEIRALIDQGVFRGGDRLPSLRQMSTQLSVSINTVIQAYTLLEDRGVIQARPQSGYYVRRHPPEIPAEPERRTLPSPRSVTVSELCHQVMHDMMNRELLPLGGAIPSPRHLPIERLGRSLSHAMRGHGDLGVSYLMPPGYEPLRVQIARRALTAGITAGPDDILLTSGCVEGVYLALSATCRRGDTIAVESPFYFNFMQMIAELGLKALEIPSTPREGISIEALRYAIGQGRISACLVITNFGNPLGSLMPDYRKRELVELLAEHSIPLIEDDIYGDLGFDRDRPSAAKSFDQKGMVIYCSSFSKTLAPGFRVGWAIAGRYQEEMERLKMIMNIAPASPTQLALAEFLSNGGYDHHLRTVRKTYEGSIARMTDAIREFFPDGTRVTHPRGGFILWVELPDGIEAMELYHDARAVAIGIVPGPLFTLSGGFRRNIRLSAALWDDRIREGIRQLGELARKQLLKQNRVVS
ncbi:MAG: PLP-dependent aminotransferase family protein [Desulfuromonadia bacterium]